MSDDEEARRLTPEEIGLLKQVFRWRRDNGKTFFLSHSFGPHGFLSWDEPRNTDGVRRGVTFDREWPDRIGETTSYHRQTFRWHEVADARQAVDLLVAYGYLPARFSSAYRAGWDARSAHAYGGNGDPDKTARLCGLPIEDDFPAVERV